MKKIIRKVYEAMPLKKQIFALLRNLNLPHNLYQHLHFKGWIKIKVDSAFFEMFHYGYGLENELFWSGINGNWESRSLDLWTKLCKQSKTILDIGANTGVYSLIAGAVNKNAEIFAFEPGRQIAIKLQRNVQKNNFNIKVYEVGISNKNGEFNFYDTEDTHNYSASLNAAHGSNTLEYKVKTQALDNFIELNNLKVDLIKIDVERHEPQVIEGFQKYIRSQLPSILIEILDIEIGRKVQELILDLPYLYFNIHENGTIKKVDKITKSDDYNYLLCREEVAKNIGLLQE